MFDVPIKIINLETFQIQTYLDILEDTIEPQLDCLSYLAQFPALQVQQTHIPVYISTLRSIFTEYLA